MNVRRHLSRPRIGTTAVAGAAALGLLTLSACGTSDAAGGSAGGSDGKLDVVASFYPMEFLAKEIGGEHVAVQSLTKPGTEPHDLVITAKQTAQLTEADVVLYLAGVQPAVDESVKQAGVKHTVDAAKLTALEDHGGDGHDHGHGDEHAEDEHGDEHADDEHAHEDEGHADEGEGHADEGSGDPHVWLDPVKYAEVAKGVGKTFEKADPDNAEDYKANTAKLVKKLDALNTDFTTGLKDTRTKTFITAHSAFGYLADRYGLDQEGIAGLNPESEPSPARMKELQKVAKAEDVTTVFFETLASDKTAKTLAADTGLKTDVLDPLEGITDRSKGDDYFEVMQANLTALEKALGAK
ncbi:metal ABC transporter substrate-binding protein [Streptomyces apocyni]|uniref:metal ABC transporter substrate-binding protein n=1 Tax=Streptomyces apocyni TaxID=2654677 RepID=UPI0012EA5A2B|nr:metal ABC transporter substrate-binding protein [Streptomyces apocyni]